MVVSAAAQATGLPPKVEACAPGGQVIKSERATVAPPPRLEEDQTFYEILETQPGVSDEEVSFFHARGLTRVGPGGGDETEDITVHEVALGELSGFFAEKQTEGLGVDPKIYAGLYLAGIHTHGLSGNSGS